MGETLLETISLTKTFTARRGAFGRKVATVAVENLNLAIQTGETLGLVGESGCGKSTLARTIMRLYTPDGGKIFFAGRDITHARESDLKPVRRQMQMIFQDPFAALDPRLRVAQIIAEPLEIHNVGTKSGRRQVAAEMLERVGLSAGDLDHFAAQFSGGQQQRIGIARALVLRPKLIICDEAVSSLDVSVQAQVLNLLRDLQDDFGLSYLFISHNIAVTAFMSRRIGVMFSGKLVEIGDARRITTAPLHPYTRALIAAIPQPGRRSEPESELEINDEPAAEARPSGCVYRLRCPHAQEICAVQEPLLRSIGDNDTAAACHLV